MDLLVSVFYRFYNFSIKLNNLLGFWISIFTLFAAIKIRKKIIQANEKKDLFKNIDQLIQTLEGYILLFERENLSNQSLKELDTYLRQLLANYSFTRMNIKLSIKKSIKLLTQKPINYKKLKNSIIKISAYYKKETQYENSKF